MGREYKREGTRVGVSKRVRKRGGESTLGGERVRRVRELLRRMRLCETERTRVR